jgi:uncharacterized membrane protein YjdF
MEDTARRIHRILIVTLLLIMCGELVIVLLEQQWMNAFLIVGIITVTLMPLVLKRQYHVHIPAEFQILAIIFIFASLFLGEIYSYYERFWWWDVILHASSGLLMGILGFLLVYLLNETEHAEVVMTPRFVALFAFLFSVAVGALWEIFEFTMDRTLGMNMQKPTLNDPTGLTDTMWDLIVDTLGALVISTLGWRHMVKGENSFINRWIRKFIARNPQFFNRYLMRKPRFFYRHRDRS